MPNGSGSQLASAPTHMKPALRLLLTDYLVEFAAIERKVPTRDANGHVPYKYFDNTGWRLNGFRSVYGWRISLLASASSAIQGSNGK
jgi:hypothetical protein